MVVAEPQMQLLWHWCKPHWSVAGCQHLLLLLKDRDVATNVGISSAMFFWKPTDDCKNRILFLPDDWFWTRISQFTVGCITPLITVQKMCGNQLCSLPSILSILSACLFVLSVCLSVFLCLWVCCLLSVFLFVLSSCVCVVCALCWMVSVLHTCFSLSCRWSMSAPPPTVNNDTLHINQTLLS